MSQLVLAVTCRQWLLTLPSIAAELARADSHAGPWSSGRFRRGHGGPPGGGSGGQPADSRRARRDFPAPGPRRRCRWPSSSPRPRPPPALTRSRLQPTRNRRCRSRHRAERKPGRPRPRRAAGSTFRPTLAGEPVHARRAHEDLRGRSSSVTSRTLAAAEAPRAAQEAPRPGRVPASRRTLWRGSTRWPRRSGTICAVPGRSPVVGPAEERWYRNWTTRGRRQWRGSWSSSRDGSRTRVVRIRTHPGSAPTVKQHLAAIRMLGDWLVVSQVLPVNPAAAVRGPKHVVTKGATPVLSPAEARKLLASIDTGALAGAPGPGAALGHALQLRAGERGVGDEAARRAGPPPRGRGPRRLRRGGRA